MKQRRLDSPALERYVPDNSYLTETQVLSDGQNVGRHSDLLPDLVGEKGDCVRGIDGKSNAMRATVEKGVDSKKGVSQPNRNPPKLSSKNRLRSRSGNLLPSHPRNPTITRFFALLPPKSAPLRKNSAPTRHGITPHARKPRHCWLSDLRSDTHQEILAFPQIPPANSP